MDNYIDSCFLGNGYNGFNLLVMKETRFLIIASGYNVEKYVEGCLASIEKQTYRNFEVLVVSDGSTDGTFKKITDFLAFRMLDNSKYKAVLNTHNGGIVHARGVALPLNYNDLNCDVMIWLDLDDEIKPNALERIAKEYQDQECWLTYGNFIIKDTGKIGLTESQLQYEDKPARLQDWKFIPVRSWRKELYYHLTKTDLFPPRREVYPDINMLFCLMEMAGKKHIRIINEVLYVYDNMNPISVTRRFTKEQRDSELNFIKSLPPKEPLKDL